MITLDETLIRESNLIEGIDRDPTNDEIAEFARFMRLKQVRVADLCQFVNIYQPGALLRTQSHDNVTVGFHVPPAGGQRIVYLLDGILSAAREVGAGAWKIHCMYENLHPFMDCNGRSGRMLWFWMMQRAAYQMPFLQKWYYQSLQQGG